MILRVAIPHNPRLLLLNDHSDLNLKGKIISWSYSWKKKMIACRWKTAEALSVRQWLASFGEIGKF